MRKGDVAIVVAVLVVLGVWVVPAHVMSMWMDFEFTGWVVPVANRLLHGPRLYTDGAHSPIPPLSFAIAFLASWGHGVWLTENALDYLFRSLLILTMYVGLAPYLSWPVPLAAALLVLPLYLGFPKSILYDSTVQLATAVLAVTAVRLVIPPDGSPPSPVRAARRLGILAALVILSKQNTGIGASLGTALLLWLATPTRPLRERVEAIAWLGGSTALALVGGLVLLSPLASPTGFFVDVFVHGAAAKGGSATLLRQLWESALLAAVPAVVTAVVVPYVEVRGRAPASPPDRTDAAVPLAVALLVVVALSLAVILGPPQWRGWVPAERSIRAGLLRIGMVMAMVLVVLRAAAWRTTPPARTPADVLAAFALVTFPPALMHGMSTGVPIGRINYDANAFATVQVVLPLAMLLGAPVATRGARAVRATAALVLVVFGGLAMWEALQFEMVYVRRCTASWPEVGHLRGARVRPEGEGIRQLVENVRRMTQPTDTVLLLPEDPDIFAWFDRPRPPVGSAILFVDQYGEDYVDADFARLQAEPPKMIIIGPRDYWKYFQGWNRSIVMLEEHIRKQLLPGRYRRQTIQPIRRGGEEDVMDAWIRLD